MRILNNFEKIMKINKKETKHNRSEVIEKCVDIYFKNEGFMNYINLFKLKMLK